MMGTPERATIWAFSKKLLPNGRMTASSVDFSGMRSDAIKAIIILNIRSIVAGNTELEVFIIS
jgi:hypothetical protein